MQPFHLDFVAPEYNPTDSPLVTAPGFRLDPPEAGWIICHIEGADFLPLRMSYVFPPLADLWLWSVAVARGLLPVTVRIDEEGTVVLFSAEERPEGRLRLSLIRRMETLFFSEPGEVIDAIAWTEERRAFLARWGTSWATYCLDDTLPWDEWERFEEKRFPEPMRDMPWEKLADFPELEAPSWTYQQRIAWFYLSMAHQMRSRGHGCEYIADPDSWTLRELAFARLAIHAAQSAWMQLHTGAPPQPAALHLIDDAYELIQDDPEASARDEQTSRLSLDRAHLDVTQATFDYIADIAGACLPQLPIGASSFMADQEGRRAVILRAEGRDWLLYWDDGRITREDAFHARRQDSCHWPVAAGPRFDRDTLDPIDTRRLRFLELNVSPVNVVCPICGYPCMDDDWIEIEYCEFCGFTLFEYDGNEPLPDPGAAEGGPRRRLRRTLRECRKNFLRWGDVLHPGFPRRKLGRWRKVMLTKAYRQLAQEAMAEWDAWLENPDPAHTPEEVWRRWKRWEDEQR